MATSPVTSVLTCCSFSVLHFFPVLYLVPILCCCLSCLYSFIFLLLPVLFISFQSLIFLFYIDSQTFFQILPACLPKPCLLPLLNNLCSQLLLSRNTISVIISDPLHKTQSVALRVCNKYHLYCFFSFSFVHSNTQILHMGPSYSLCWISHNWDWGLHLKAFFQRLAMMTVWLPPPQLLFHCTVLPSPVWHILDSLPPSLETLK